MPVVTGLSSTIVGRPRQAGLALIHISGLAHRELRGSRLDDRMTNSYENFVRMFNEMIDQSIKHISTLKIRNIRLVAV